MPDELTVEQEITALFNGATLDEKPPVEETDTGAETEAPDTTEPEVPAAEDEDSEAEAEPEAETLLAGKYKTAEELEKAYAEAQRLIGEQGNELGQLRKLSDEMAALRESLPTQQQPAYDPGSVDEWLAENPQSIPAAAQQAIDQNDGYLYQKAIAAWGELDSVGAMDFHARQVAAAQVAQLRQELAPALQTVAQTQTTNEFATAYENVAAQHEDFSAVMNSITAENIAGFPPEVIGALQTGDQASKQRVLETLYRWTKAEQAGNLTTAQQAATRQQAEDGRQARAEAQVASTTGSQNREPATPTAAFIEAFEGSAAFKKAAGLPL